MIILATPRNEANETNKNKSVISKSYKTVAFYVGTVNIVYTLSSAQRSN